MLWDPRPDAPGDDAPAASLLLCFAICLLGEGSSNAHVSLPHIPAETPRLLCKPKNSCLNTHHPQRCHRLRIHCLTRRHRRDLRVPCALNVQHLWPSPSEKPRSRPCRRQTPLGLVSRSGKHRPNRHKRPRPLRDLRSISDHPCKATYSLAVRECSQFTWV